METLVPSVKKARATQPVEPSDSASAMSAAGAGKARGGKHFSICAASARSQVGGSQVFVKERLQNRGRRTRPLDDQLSNMR
jgi:hypothetical protein